jgi:hypothetical protein
MKRFYEDFHVLLNGFNFETLENDSNSIFGLSTDLTFNYLNPAWFSFSEKNEGEPAISERFGLGTHIGDALSGSARDYYLDIFQRVLQKGEVWHHDYECSSPKKFRLYHQSVYPLYNRSGLVIVNSLVTEQPFDESLRRSYPPIMNLYTQETGFIIQCSNCRRVQRAPKQDVWDWVPVWIENMPENTSHSICPICFEYYYEFKYPSKK